MEKVLIKINNRKELNNIFDFLETNGEKIGKKPF